MKYAVPSTLAALLLLLGVQCRALAHCEVPCGIYGDQQRFEAMLEDHTTVAKAMAEIAKLADKTDALSKNQLARWVANKESHATHIQHVISQYFMAQRLKPADMADDAAWKKYVTKLTKAHAVMRQAMKCKQTVDPAEAAKLRGAILAFYEAYEGKKPKKHDHGHEHK